MTSEQMERTIEFLLEHHTKFSAGIDRLTESQQRLSDTVVRMASEITQVATEAKTDRRESRERLNGVITEMRDSFDKPILANEVTRDLANKVASLEVQTSWRVTSLEYRVTDLEQKP